LLIDAQVIFSIIEIIAKINGEFLKTLEDKMKDWELTSTTVGDIMMPLVALAFLL
jgi:hypothetical protein